TPRRAQARADRKKRSGGIGKRVWWWWMIGWEPRRRALAPQVTEQLTRAFAMPSKPIPGSTGEVLTCLPSPYLAHPATGLLYLPRFLAKIRYVQAHGALPKSYAKNYKRGLDRFLCMHLGIDPAAV